MGAVAAAMLATVVARAEPRRAARLAYSRAAGAEACPDEPALRDAVAVRLGYDPFTPDRGPLLNATVRRAGGGLRASIEMRNDAGAVVGARELSSTHADCVELASFVALAISLAIDPLASKPAPPVDAPVPEPLTPPPELPAPPPRPPPAALEKAGVTSDPSRPRSLFMAAGAGITGWGAAPAAAVDIVVSAGFTRAQYSIALEGHAQLPSKIRAERHDSDVEASLLGAALVPCLHYARFAGCGVTLVGALSGSSNAARPDRQTTPFLEVGLRGVYEQPLSSAVALALWVEGDAVFTRTTFLFQDGPVWHSASFGTRLGTALKVYFP